MKSRTVKIAAAIAAAAFIIIRWRTQCLLALRLVVGGALIAFLIAPLCLFLARRLHFNRPLAILSTYLLILAVIFFALRLLLPALICQITELFAALPRLINDMNAWIEEKRCLLPLIPAPADIPLPDVPVLDGTVSLASRLISGVTELTLMITLAYYFIRDRERIGLRLELLVPARWRKAVLKTVGAIRLEMGAYIRCQMLISLIVGALAALFLALAGVRAALALGVIVGIFNLIPYFGPILGGAPALIMAASGGFKQMLFAALALFIVQQIDGMIVSPRLLGAACSLHPALVLIAITVGGSLAGVAGMLFSVPVVLIFRSIARNWPIRYESV